MELSKFKKTQAIITYALLIALVVVALIFIAHLIQGRLQGQYKKTGDVFGQGQQFSPEPGGTILESIFHSD